MELLQSIVLGLLQGITEFLPISSSGHLLVVREIFGWEDPGVSFDAAIHLGTLAASIYVFKDEIVGVLKSQQDWVKVVIAVIPALIVGVVIKDSVDANKSVILTAFSLILIGLIFLAYPREKSRKRSTEYKLPSPQKTLAIGLAQVLAFIPGVSRSGITILAGKMNRVKFQKALYTSFILGIPVIAAAGGWGLLSHIRGGHTFEAIPFAVALVTSTISGLFAGNFLKNRLSRIGLKPFGIYRIALGAIVLLLQII